MTVVTFQPANVDRAGSRWHRWDPHIHAPGTVLNNQYKGPMAWEDYLTLLEQATPCIRALGITDYLSLDTYEKVVAAKKNGRLPDVDFIFPNVELRYGVGTVTGSAINLHLLVNPADPNHVAETRRFLAGLTFRPYGDVFRCTRDDLIRLGKAHDATVQDDRAALKVGTEQFKVEPAELKELLNASQWVQDNILIAVAAGGGDGTAGLRDSSFAAMRKDLERSAQIVFSSNPRTRDFWLGQGAASLDELNRDYGGCKPCLHGSDAHAPGQVGAPAEDRFCWLKGDLNFETLRHACLEPAGRSAIAPIRLAAQCPPM